jgi:Cdc6-like AAA superfamily ATPase
VPFFFCLCQAYRLDPSRCPSGESVKALDELVQCLTEVQFQSKMIVILAGYESEMESLMAANPGLNRRFERRIDFAPFTTQQACDMLRNELKKEKLQLSEDAAVGLHEHMAMLRAAPEWSSAGDVLLLLKAIRTARWSRLYKPVPSASSVSPPPSLSSAAQRVSVEDLAVGFAAALC